MQNWHVRAQMLQRLLFWLQLLVQQAVREVIFKVGSDASFIAVPPTYMSSTRLSTVITSGIPCWQCWIHVCVACCGKEAKPELVVYRGRLHPPYSKPLDSEGLVNQSQMKEKSNLWGSCQGRVFLAEGDNSWLKWNHVSSKLLLWSVERDAPHSEPLFSHYRKSVLNLQSGV